MRDAGRGRFRHGGATVDFRFHTAMKILAFDPGLAKMAWCLLVPDGKRFSYQTGLIGKNLDSLNEIVRLAAIRDAVRALLIDKLPNVAAMEGYSWGSKFKGPTMGEVGGIVKIACHDAGVPLKIVAPTTLKKFVTGNGRSDKAVVRTKIFSRWKCEFATQDEAEAFAVAQWASKLAV